MKHILNGTGLPNYFKVIGTVIFILGILSKFILSKYDFEHDIVQKVILTTLLTSLLLFIISKEKNEDEMTVRIRMISLSYSFILLVIIVIPSLVLTVPFFNPLIMFPSLRISTSVTSKLN